MSATQDLKKVRISFIQWFCNPVEIALLRTGVLTVMLLLLAGTVAAGISEAVGQAALLGGNLLLITLIFRRTFISVISVFMKGGEEIFIRDDADYFEIGTHPSQIMRIDKNVVIQNNGVFGVVNIQVKNGLFNMVIPKGCIS